MTIDPRFGFWFSVAMTIVATLGVCGAYFTTLFGPHTSELILAGLAILNAINSAINAILHAIPSKPGSGNDFALGPKTTAPVILLALLILGTLAFPGDASAQAPGLRQLKPLTGNLANDLGITKPSGGGIAGNAVDSALSALAKPFQDIANFIGEDADRAVALSTAVPDIQDGHGQQCAMGLSSFGKIIKAHPVPLTLHVVTDFEALRLLAIATNRLCANVHCTQVFADVSAMAQAASPIPLPIPALHDLCTKVPQIALVDPVPVPAAAPDAPK